MSPKLLILIEFISFIYVDSIVSEAFARSWVDTPRIDAAEGLSASSLRLDWTNMVLRYEHSEAKVEVSEVWKSAVNSLLLKLQILRKDYEELYPGLAEPVDSSQNVLSIFSLEASKKIILEKSILEIDPKTKDPVGMKLSLKMHLPFAFLVDSSRFSGENSTSPPVDTLSSSGIVFLFSGDCPRPRPWVRILSGQTEIFGLNSIRQEVFEKNTSGRWFRGALDSNLERFVGKNPIKIDISHSKETGDFSVSALPAFADLPFHLKEGRFGFVCP